MARGTPRQIGETSISESGKALLAGMNPDSEVTPVESPETTPESTPVPAVQRTVETPESTPAPVAVVAEPVSEATPSAGTPVGLLDELKSMGFENLESEDQARQRLLEAYKEREAQYEQVMSRVQQVTPLAQYGQQYLQLMQNPAFQQFQAQSQPNVTAAPPVPKDDRWWAPPAFDALAVEKYREVKLDPATGEQKLEWKPNTPPEVRSNVEAHTAYLEKWADDLVRRPHEVLPKIIRAEFDKYFDDRYGNIQQQNEVEQLASRIKQDNADWMFRRDPRTNQVLDGEFTPQGQQAMSYLSEAMQLGIQAPNSQWRYVERCMAADQGQQFQQQHQQQASATEVAAKKKQELLARGNGNSALPARGGSIPARGAGSSIRSQNPSLSPGQQFLAELEADGVLV